MKRRRPLLLWGLVLGVLALAIVSMWRGWVLWNERVLLAELESTLSPSTLTLFVVLFALCGLGLGISALGLWWRRAWARSWARACVPFYYLVAQVYTWLFVRSGLMWERRWVALIVAICIVGLGTSVLSWHRSRQWLGLG
jgi:hypothetical protein